MIPETRESRDPHDDEGDDRYYYYSPAEYGGPTESRDDAEETGDTRGTDYWRALNHVDLRDEYASPPCSPRTTTELGLTDEEDERETRDNVSSPVMLSPPSLIRDPISPPGRTDGILAGEQPNNGLYIHHVQDSMALSTFSEGLESCNGSALHGSVGSIHGSAFLRSAPPSLDGDEHERGGVEMTNKQEQHPNLDDKIQEICRELSVSYSEVEPTTREGDQLECRDQVESSERDINVAHVSDTTEKLHSSTLKNVAEEPVDNEVKDETTKKNSPSKPILAESEIEQIVLQSLKLQREPWAEIESLSSKEDLEEKRNGHIAKESSDDNARKAAQQETLEENSDRSEQTSDDGWNRECLEETRHWDNSSHGDPVSMKASVAQAMSPLSSSVTSAATPISAVKSTIVDSIVGIIDDFDTELSLISSTSNQQKQTIYMSSELDQSRNNLSHATQKKMGNDRPGIIGGERSSSSDDEDDKSSLELIAAIDFEPSLKSAESNKAGGDDVVEVRTKGEGVRQNTNKDVDPIYQGANQGLIDTTRIDTAAEYINAKVQQSVGCMDFSECLTCTDWEAIFRASFADGLGGKLHLSNEGERTPENHYTHNNAKTNTAVHAKAENIIERSIISDHDSKEEEKIVQLDSPGATAQTPSEVSDREVYWDDNAVTSSDDEQREGPEKNKPSSPRSEISSLSAHSFKNPPHSPVGSIKSPPLSPVGSLKSTPSSPVSSFRGSFRGLRSAEDGDDAEIIASISSTVLSQG